MHVKILALVWFGFKEATNLNVIQNVSLFCENFFFRLIDMLIFIEQCSFENQLPIRIIHSFIHSHLFDQILFEICRIFHWIHVYFYITRFWDNNFNSFFFTFESIVLNSYFRHTVCQRTIDWFSFFIRLRIILDLKLNIICSTYYIQTEHHTFKSKIIHSIWISLIQLFGHHLFLLKNPFSCNLFLLSIFCFPSFVFKMCSLIFAKLFKIFQER